MYDELVNRLRCQRFGNCPNCPMWYTEEVEPNLWRERCAAIDAADAIEELSMKLHGDEAAIVGMQREIERMVVADKPRWIPVTERLPEKNRASYLCRTDGGYHCEVRWTDNVYGLWGGGNNWGWSIFDIPQYSKITHWMPLPEPPNEET